MTSPRSSLKVRVFSAIVALTILFSLYFFLKLTGLVIIILFCSVLAQIEYAHLVIDKADVSFSRALLVTGGFIINLSALLSPHAVGLPLGVVIVVFFSFFMIHNRSSTSLAHIRDLIGISALGLLYVGVLPAFVI